MLKTDGNKIIVSTKTLDAVLENGVITQLCDKNGVRYIRADEKASEGLQIVYRRWETVPIKNTMKGTVHTCSLSDTCVEIRYDAWDGTGLITVSEDIETGDLCIEPEVTSARQGILAARYIIEGIEEGYTLVAPLYQGVDMQLEDELLKNRKWSWPFTWEAGLCILHNTQNGFWVHCEDHQYRCKSLMTGQKNRGLAFDSETYGPVERSVAAGGIRWRINVFEGDWHVPALRYRNWLYKAYSLDKEQAKRKEWIGDIRLAISWCPSSTALLDELAKKIDPKKVLLHLPNWRTKTYDQCYPDYTPSDHFVQFIKYASEKGFHCMPHANSVDMDPSMPEYHYLTDFKYRDVEHGRFLGWGWDNGRVLGVPSSNMALTQNRDKNVMVKIHPGLALWRSLLAENINSALKQMDFCTDTVFIDVTLCSYNLDNCLVDNTTSMEGMKRIIAHVEAIGRGIAVGGEGLNEITMQNLSFAQAHLFDSHQHSSPGLSRCGGCDLNHFMFGGLCKTIGYSNLSGNDENQVLRERIHEEHGAIPTITVGHPEQIASPNAEIRRVLELANR